MSLTVAAERRLLSDGEFELVSRTHYPAIADLEKPELIDAARLLREHRNKARDVSQALRRERRGKAEARAARAPNEARLLEKKQVFAAALKRLNREIARQDDQARRHTQAEIAQRALELRRASRHQHHPSFRTAHHGMRPLESAVRRTQVDPRMIGSVSQQNRDFQARRDA
jgi:hypothetical protein